MLSTGKYWVKYREYAGETCDHGGDPLSYSHHVFAGPFRNIEGCEDFIRDGRYDGAEIYDFDW